MIESTRRLGCRSASRAIGFFVLLSAASNISFAAVGSAFLKIPVGARPAALGSAYSAEATDAYAPVINPAGLARLPDSQIAAQHLAYLESINYEYAALCGRWARAELAFRR